METKYITVKIRPDKPRRRPARRNSVLLDFVLFGTCIVSMYIVVCAVLVLGGLT